MAAAENSLSGQDRMTGDQRRVDLLDLTLEMFRDGGLEAVSIGAVAERAGVTRTLIYKHFANRQDLMREVYRREAAKLYISIRAEVEQHQGFEARLRAFIDSVIGAVDTHGWLFSPRDSRGFPEDEEQSQRDRRTINSFAQLASKKFDITLREATSAMGILLSGISSLRMQAYILTDASDREFLANLYMDLIMGAFNGLQHRHNK